jgi:Spy/CpxP family protein refolding chaperone
MMKPDNLFTANRLHCRSILKFKLAPLFAILLGLPPAAQAAGDSLTIEPRVGCLQEQLNLTPNQTIKVRDILLPADEQARKDETIYHGSPEASAEMAAIRGESVNEQIMAILYQEQQAKYETIKNQLPGPSRRPPYGDVEERTRQLAERLKLAEKQTAQVKEILAAAELEMQKLCQERQNDRSEREGMRPDMQAMRAKMEEIDKKIEAILTDEQQAEYQKYKEERRQHTRPGMGPGGGKQPRQR